MFVVWCVLLLLLLLLRVVVVVVCCGCCGCGGGGGETDRTVWLLVPSEVSLRIAETQQLYQVKPMNGGIGNMLFSIYSQTENV